MSARKKTPATDTRTYQGNVELAPVDEYAENGDEVREIEDTVRAERRTESDPANDPMLEVETNMPDVTAEDVAVALASEQDRTLDDDDVSAAMQRLEDMQTPLPVPETATP